MKNRSLVLFAIILLAALSRLIPHPSNFTPITGMALFAGAYLPNRKWAWTLPLAAMVISDLIIGFHSTLPAIYLLIIGMTFLGSLLNQSNLSWTKLAGTTLGSSIVFFLGSNFAVWAMQDLYPKTATGLAECYIAAIPFFQNSLMGDFFYVTVLFGGYSLVRLALDQQKTDIVVS